MPRVRSTQSSVRFRERVADRGFCEGFSVARVLDLGGAGPGGTCCRWWPQLPQKREPGDMRALQEGHTSTGSFMSTAPFPALLARSAFGGAYQQQVFRATKLCAGFVRGCGWRLGQRRSASAGACLKGYHGHKSLALGNKEADPQTVQSVNRLWPFCAPSVGRTRNLRIRSSPSGLGVKWAEMSLKKPKDFHLTVRVLLLLY
jgi:hypothetical protein